MLIVHFLVVSTVVSLRNLYWTWSHFCLAKALENINVRTNDVSQLATNDAARIRQLPAIDPGLVGWGAARAEDAQGTPTQGHVSPSILVYEEK